MSADPRTDPPTPDPLTPPDPFDPDQRYLEDRCGYRCMFTRDQHETNDRIRHPFMDRAALPSAPDQRLRDDLPAELERHAGQGVVRVTVPPDLLRTAAAALRVLTAALSEATTGKSPEDIFDRLMTLWQEPWSEPAFGEAQMLLCRLRAALSEATTSPEASLDVARLRAAKFVAGHWLDAVMSSDSLRQTGMSHPLAMVLAAIDGETDPRQLGLPPSLDDEFAARLRGPA